ncbi:NUDIX domain-containing protein [Halosimplex halobium]|uniref:NUDIX domain-containing protein n=1 Tax=Halosimplex halobium TaxID=3396618 RepID=UPI003F57F1B2
MTGESDGTAEVPSEADLDETHVVTVFLRNDGDVLLLRRSDAVGSYTGQWGAVAGHAEGDPDAAAREEVREETGIDPGDEAALVRRGDPFEVVDEDLGRRWIVHPYLFDCEVRTVEPNEETDEFEWTAPTAILRRETVPDLWTSYDRVRPTVETVAEDAEHGSAWISLRALEVLRDEAALAVERAGGDDAAGAGGDRRDADGDDADGRPADWTDLVAVARALLDARPSMAVVANRVNRAMDAASEEATPAALEPAALEGIRRASDADSDAAAVVTDRFPDRVATLSRSGTVAAAVERADPDSVLVAESRPGREGVDTAERFADRTDAAVTVTTDAALADRLAATDIEAVVVGADTILPDGRVVNKVGTRGAAAAAATEGIDCYVVAASDKIAAASAEGRTSTGPDVDREERDPREVYDGDAAVGVANPTFDVTPPDLVDAVVTERGALDADEVRAVADEHAGLTGWDE